MGETLGGDTLVGLGELRLGLGLVSIGRVWGVHGGSPLDEAAAQELIVGAVGLGIAFFDTAPAYGVSEAILGRALATVPTSRNRLTIATKIGEHWVDAASPTMVDHSYDALCRSLDRSIRHLGRIDVLQIHKATPDNLRSAGVAKAMDYARSLGIRQFGASISDEATAQVAAESGQFGWLQFPFNAQSPALGPLFPLLADKRVTPIINRPLAMGALAAVPAAEKPTAIRAALQLIHAHCRAGVIITGTRHLAHLAETLAAHRSLAGSPTGGP
jgi:aryl-alcohol dehydrogenase-like predicted oxidoreductase